MCTRRIRTSHEPPIRDRKAIPRSGRSNILCTRTRCTRLNSRSIPALDRVKDAFPISKKGVSVSESSSKRAGYRTFPPKRIGADVLFFTLGCKTCDPLARNNWLLRLRVEDAGKNCTSVAHSREDAFIRCIDIRSQRLQALGIRIIN